MEDRQLGQYLFFWSFVFFCLSQFLDGRTLKGGLCGKSVKILIRNCGKYFLFKNVAENHLA